MQDYSYDLGEVFFSICKAVDTPVSLGAWLRYKHGEFRALAEMGIRPSDYNDRQRFSNDYLVVSFLSKQKGLKTGIDTKAVATQSFKTSEDSCRKVNTDFRIWRTGGFPPPVASLLFRMQRKIAQILGPFDLSKVSRCGWTVGANTDLRRSEALIDEKLCKSPLPVSDTARAFLRRQLCDDLHWLSAITGHEVIGPCELLPSHFASANWCRIETVPKNAKTDRIIAVEPRGNIFLQKGVGNYIRSRLKAFDVDLDDQSRNQLLAERAYKDGLATIDLKAASDSIATELVFELLPLDWAHYLNCVRSRYGKLGPSEFIKLEKFSSMGNGFTFELQSMIFYALLCAVEQGLDESGVKAVYGDDIICEQRFASDVVSALESIGFTVNSGKSFIGGRFFESCGRHFFDGVEVTPPYQKEPLNGIREVVRGANRLLRAYAAGHRCVSNGWHGIFRAVSSIPRFPFLPSGLDRDDGLQLPQDLFNSHWLAYDPNRGYRVRIIPSTLVSFPANDRALLAWSLRRGVVTSSPYHGDVTREGPDSRRTVERWVQPSRDFLLTLK